MKVNFIEVGRYKTSWSADIEPIESNIVKQIRGRKVLASKFFDVDMDTGGIFAGMRQVGRFELEPFTGIDTTQPAPDRAGKE